MQQIKSPQKASAGVGPKSPAKQADARIRRRKPIVSAPANKGARREVYGFVGWMTSFVCFGAFLMWSLLPDSILHQLGIYYYPDRWWALGAPTYFVICMAYGVFIYYIINLMNTAPLNSTITIRDKHAAQVRHPKPKSPEAILPIADIPIDQVNRLMFLDKD